MSNSKDLYLLCDMLLRMLDDFNITSGNSRDNNFVDTDEFYRVLTGIEVDDDE